MAPNRAGLPENPDVAKAVIEAQLKDKGLIGRLIGNKDNAPFNIAFVAMFLVAVLMATAMAMPVQDRCAHEHVHGYYRIPFWKGEVATSGTDNSAHEPSSASADASCDTQGSAAPAALDLVSVCCRALLAAWAVPSAYAVASLPLGCRSTSRLPTEPLTERSARSLSLKPSLVRVLWRNSNSVR